MARPCRRGCLPAADAVVCQAGCIRHAAYWKLKEHCKRNNKPCIYLKRTGVGSFAHGVGLLVREVAGNGAGADALSLTQ
ncbi:MAG: DUF2325 domain-containing protein [Zoogloeaceae bacterium]|nr:DUF2325 domain-containing protein [Zoogloeaceae bacterium]